MLFRGQRELQFFVTLAVAAVTLGLCARSHAQSADLRRRSVQVSSGVMMGQILTQVPPVYPVIAKAAGVSGTVTLHAVISKTGAISDISVLSGPPMLQSAAIGAVRQWTYKPYTLNGKPVEVDTTINIVFNLGTQQKPADQQQTAQIQNTAVREQVVLSMTDAEMNALALLDTPALKDKATRGVPLAQYVLGWRYHSGWHNTAIDEGAAYFWLHQAEDAIESASQGGNVFAEYLLAGLYGDGELYTQDYAKAIGMYRDAAERGELAALRKMIFINRDALYGVRQDLPTARAWVQRLALYDPNNAQQLIRNLDQVESMQRVQSAQSLPAQPAPAYIPPQPDTTGAPAQADVADVQPVDVNAPPSNDSLLGAFVNALSDATATADPNAIQNTVNQQWANIQAAQARAAAAAQQAPQVPSSAGSNSQGVAKCPYADLKMCTVRAQ